ncbi:MAG: DUF4412 domain-containing protein [Bacteroidales bacterium]|nr:DUF4412 domain-containing protein [Bacteroidales bacterium]MDD4671782.1 DUF4412 domain-containing protein [Bacteroidales bacterium]MDY0347358.1 DUF4412 domain-containing protein [Tenuifilaceae bacterium]
MDKGFISFFVLVLISLSTLANGWHITTRYYNSPADSLQQRVEHVYLYGYNMKMVSGDLSTVFSLDKNQLLYINHSNKTYWRGNPQRFVTEVKAELIASIDQKLEGVDADKQDELRAMYMEMIDASFSDRSVVPTKNFLVQEMGEQQVVGNFLATKYQVFEEGFLLENIWIAKDLPIANDFDFISLSHFLNQLAQGAYADSFESSPEYFELLDRGYPVKVEIRRGDGSIQVSEVTSAKRVAITASDFSVPAGYSSGSLTTVGVWEGYI